MDASVPFHVDEAFNVPTMPPENEIEHQAKASIKQIAGDDAAF